MRFIERFSILTYVAAVLCGMAVHWVLASALPLCEKALCVSLLLLSSLILFVNDFEKVMLKK
jgi:hydrogenase/urease accessory protein HupE